MKPVKNCPCCDGESNWEYIGTNTIRISCSKCGIHTISDDNTLEYMKEMLNTWNSRVDEVKEVSGIKTCPCCGNEIKDIEIIDPWGNKTYKIECDCDLFTEPYDTKEELLDVWNRRVR